LKSAAGWEKIPAMRTRWSKSEIRNKLEIQNGGNVQNWSARIVWNISFSNSEFVSDFGFWILACCRLEPVLLGLAFMPGW
jgi:hypothetical protein